MIQRGFTLIELIVILALLGITAAIAIPSYLKYRSSATEAEGVGGIKTIGDTYSGAEIDSAAVNTGLVSYPEIKMEAEHYLNEYNLSTIGVTLTPLHTAGETLQEVSVLLPDPLPLPYEEIVNLNLNGTEGWTCATQTDPAPPRVTCTGPTGMAEKKKSVFTLFFNEQFSTIPSDLDLALPYSNGLLATSVPVTKN